MSYCLNSKNEYIGYNRGKCQGNNLYPMKYNDNTEILDLKLVSGATCEEIVTFQGLANAYEKTALQYSCDGTLMKRKLTENEKTTFEVVCVDENFMPKDGSDYAPKCLH